MTSVMMISQPSTGGTARHVLELSRGCRARGLAVHLVCDARDRAFCDGARAAGARVIPLELERELVPWRDAVSVLRLRDAIETFAPDVVHLHSAKAGGLGRLALRGMARRPPVIYTPHAFAFLAQPGSLRRRLYRGLERALAPSTDVVVAVSDDEARHARALGGLGHVCTVHNGVARVDATGAVHERFCVGWLGRLTWQKDPLAAVVASRVLTRLGVDHELVIAGDGPERRGVERAAATVASVRLLGHVTDPAAFYGRIDVLSITSRAEGLPYVALDAMARGIPIVAFDAPGIRELVSHGTTGLLAPAGDAGALAAQLARLARDRAMRIAMGVAARARVHERFLLDHQLDRICDLYTRLAARPHGSVH